MKTMRRKSVLAGLCLVLAAPAFANEPGTSTALPGPGTPYASH